MDLVITSTKLIPTKSVRQIRVQRPKSHYNRSYAEKPAAAKELVPSLGSKISAEEKSLIGYEKWAHEYGFDTNKKEKFKSSSMPRPQSAVAVSSNKPSFLKPIVGDIDKLITPRYKDFEKNSFTFKELMLLQKSHRSENHIEYPIKYSKKTVFLNKKLSLRKKKKEKDEWTTIVEGIVFSNSSKNLTIFQKTQPIKLSEDIFNMPKIQEDEEFEHRTGKMNGNSQSRRIMVRPGTANIENRMRRIQKEKEMFISKENK